MVELISRYSDVLACTLEKDKHGRSVGTAVVRSALRVFSLMIVYVMMMQENYEEKPLYFDLIWHVKFGCPTSFRTSRFS